MTFQLNQFLEEFFFQQYQIKSKHYQKKINVILYNSSNSSRKWLVLIENLKKNHILFLFSNPCGQNLCIEISVLSFWCWTYVYIVWLKGTFCLLYWHRKQPLKKAKHKGGSFCVKLLLYVQGIPVFHDFCFKTILWSAEIMNSRHTVFLQIWISKARATSNFVFQAC